MVGASGLTNGDPLIAAGGGMGIIAHSTLFTAGKKKMGQAFGLASLTLAGELFTLSGLKNGEHKTTAMGIGLTFAGGGKLLSCLTARRTFNTVAKYSARGVPVATALKVTEDWKYGAAAILQLVSLHFFNRMGQQRPPQRAKHSVQPQTPAAP